MKVLMNHQFQGQEKPPGELFKTLTWGLACSIFSSLIWVLATKHAHDILNWSKAFKEDSLMLIPVFKTVKCQVLYLASNVNFPKGKWASGSKLNLYLKVRICMCVLHCFILYVFFNFTDSQIFTITSMCQLSSPAHYCWNSFFTTPSTSIFAHPTL